MKTKHIPTKKIKEILNNRETYCTYIGTDYGGYVEELQEVLWSRESKAMDRRIRNFEDLQNSYEDFLDSEGVPPFPIDLNFKATK